MSRGPGRRRHQCGCRQHPPAPRGAGPAPVSRRKRRRHAPRRLTPPIARRAAGSACGQNRAAGAAGKACCIRSALRSLPAMAPHALDVGHGRRNNRGVDQRPLVSHGCARRGVILAGAKRRRQRLPPCRWPVSWQPSAACKRDVDASEALQSYALWVRLGDWPARR